MPAFDKIKAQQMADGANLHNNQDSYTAPYLRAVFTACGIKEAKWPGALTLNPRYTDPRRALDIQRVAIYNVNTNDPRVRGGFNAHDTNYVYNLLCREFYIDPLAHSPSDPYPNAFITPIIEFGRDILDDGSKWRTPRERDVISTANIEQYFKVYLEKIIADCGGKENMPPPYKIVMPFAGLKHALSMVVEINDSKEFKVTVTNPDVGNYNEIGYGNRYVAFAKLNYGVIKETLEGNGFRSERSNQLNIGPDIQIKDGPCELVNAMVGGSVLEQARSDPRKPIDFNAMKRGIPQKGINATEAQEIDYWSRKLNQIKQMALASIEPAPLPTRSAVVNQSQPERQIPPPQRGAILFEEQNFVKSAQQHQSAPKKQAVSPISILYLPEQIKLSIRQEPDQALNIARFNVLLKKVSETPEFKSAQIVTLKNKVDAFAISCKPENRERAEKKIMPIILEISNLTLEQLNTILEPSAQMGKKRF